MDFSIFATPEAWISLLTLMFLRWCWAWTTSCSSPSPPTAGARAPASVVSSVCWALMISRCIFLCFASYLVHMTKPLFTLDLGFFQHAFNVRDLVLLAGGAYLIYKGIDELRDVLALTEEKAAHSEEHKELHRIGLGQAIATIMVMDLVFSIDSVITAVGLAEHLIIMVMAVIFAIVIMMVFIDAIADFINRHTEMKILALVFITVIGMLLFFDSLGINSGIEVLDMHMEKLMVYCAMVFAVVLELIQMRYNSNLAKWKEERKSEDLERKDGKNEGARRGEPRKGEALNS